MIIGAQKCGTTTLYSALNTHPNIVGCVEKEPHFFSRTADWRRNLADYESMFPRTPDALYFEASTSYTFYPVIKNLRLWDDIYDYNPSMKFIYVIRDPIDRIISSYIHTYERGYIDGSLEYEIINNPFFVCVSKYYMQIAPFIATFGADSVHVVRFDDLVSNIQTVLDSVASFLGVDAAGFTDHEEIHANATFTSKRVDKRFDNPNLPLRILRRTLPAVWSRLTDNSERVFDTKPVIDDTHREVILRMLGSDISSLEALLNTDLSAWYAGYEHVVHLNR